MSTTQCGKWAGAHAILPGQPRDSLCNCAAPTPEPQPADHVADASKMVEPTDSMGIPLSCGKPLCAPGDHHPLCNLAQPAAQAVAPELAGRLRNFVWVRHIDYARPEPEGYVRDTAPNEAADIIAMLSAQIAAAPVAQPLTPLTDEQIKALSNSCYDGGHTDPLILFARAIECAHGIGASKGGA